MNLHSHTHIPVYIYKYYVILIITLQIANDKKLKNIITNGGGGGGIKGWMKRMNGGREGCAGGGMRMMN